MLTTPLLAQVPPSMQFHEPTRCVFHEGDDPRWAEPAYNDTAWGTHAGSSRNPHLWERCHFAPVLDAVRGDFDLQFRAMADWIAIRTTRRYVWDNRFAWDAVQLSPALGSHARLELRGVRFALENFGGGGIVTANRPVDSLRRQSGAARYALSWSLRHRWTMPVLPGHKSPSER